MSQRIASRMFGVPRSTIQFRMSGAFVKSTSDSSPVLTHNGEEDLVKWLIKCSKKGFPRRLENIQASVKYFLETS